jgi:anti-sigma B factor antagonist
LTQWVRVERAGRVAVVDARGELDAFSASELGDAFAEIASDERVLIDLSRVSFMDSTALGLVVKTVNEITDRGGDLRLILPTQSARRIFEITMLDRVLPIEATRDAALTALGEGSSRVADGAF